MMFDVLLRVHSVSRHLSPLYGPHTIIYAAYASIIIVDGNNSLKETKMETITK